MSWIQKASKICLNHKLFPLNCYLRVVHTTHLADTDEKSEKVPEVVFDILEELREPELTEEEILQKRFKARLPERVYRQFVLKEPVPFDAKYNFKILRLRAYYARFGKASNLKPGLSWPTREEILETIEEDKIFEPPLETRLKNVQEARLAEEERKRLVEAEVDKNMANLDKWMSDYHDKIEKKKAEVKALKEKKEKLIDEISEYLGYEIDPRDPRFQEAVEQRNKEQKKARKVQKQQENYDKMIAKLKLIAQQK